MRCGKEKAGLRERQQGLARVRDGLGREGPGAVSLPAPIRHQAGLAPCAAPSATVWPLQVSVSLFAQREVARS